MTTECPFCEAAPADRAEHIATYHRDRLRAILAYQRVLSGGGTARQAEQTYNESLRPARPGQYDRSAFRRAS